MYSLKSNCKNHHSQSKTYICLLLILNHYYSRPQREILAVAVFAIVLVRMMMKCLLIILAPIFLHHVVHDIFMDQKVQKPSKHQPLQSQKIIKTTILKPMYLPSLLWLQVLSLKVKFLQ